MTTELRCGCNEAWIIIVSPNLNYRYMAGTQCPVCGYHMWYDAYEEDMFRDLKEMNT